MAAAGAATLHVKDNFNAEDAAHAANEFVMSLDNLPAEVAFLLAEIREKDNRINVLVERMNKRHQNLTRHKVTSSTAPSNTTFPLPFGPGQTITGDHLPQKEGQALAKIQSEWVKVQDLQDEKVKLAERMERIVSRARERGKAEWARVGGLEMEEIEKIEGTVGGLGRLGLGELGGGEVMLPPGGLGSGSDRMKKRNKPTALPLPPSFSNMPVMHPPPTSMLPPPLPSSSSLARSSGNANISSSGRHRKPRRRSPDPSEDDEDAQGDMEDVEEESGMAEEDDQIYCFCNGKVQNDQMIGCDNPGCEIEWYHCSCVGVGEIPETWYCPQCVLNLGLRNATDEEGFKRKVKKGRNKRER